ncbi:DUF4097 family beta strand repeat-containing protein [Kitasatospora viridis]|uniref:Putative adhesin n=1 Tax=Kitasatospora viridis TaxID=281105 RepID=A0A561UJR5_9ACTN|nr:DUF4097 family beta strand repeat-containing protein [Kitasatospora viridis]TWF99599.1 putative adhesin [Kitasatospora viridis]
MPTFDTIGPITATVEIDIASVRVIAGDRADTVVEVLPADGASDRDVQQAQQTKVTFTAGRLLVKSPKKRSVFAKVGSVDVTVELPAGSELVGTLGVGGFRCEGPLGNTRLKTAAGDIRVDGAADADLRTSHGDVVLELATGDVEVSGGGRVELGRLLGTATVRNSHGDTSVREVVGNLVAKTAMGRITVGTAHADVEAKSANGPIRIAEVTRGQVQLNTGMGDVEVGIREGTAAWLDASTGLGTVRNSLGSADGPDDAARTVELRVRTSLGDISVVRA